jgi:hypothetical protein
MIYPQRMLTIHNYKQSSMKIDVIKKIIIAAIAFTIGFTVMQFILHQLISH